MPLDFADTIAAIASAAGPAPTAIIRVSGANCRQVVESVFIADDPQAWATARLPRAHPGRLVRDELRGLEARCLLWPGTRSYTGQPMAELHLVGCPPLVDLALNQLLSAGGRPARPGEFTLRAFMAGRIDLVQAEAVLGVIDSADHVQLEQALRQLAGGLSGRLGSWRGVLLDLLADLEAGLDFVDEGIEFVPHDVVCQRLGQAARELTELADQARDRLESDVRPLVVLVGPPNAGKSTLLNCLSGAEAAIVSPTSGTTRDYVTVDVNWSGQPLRLVDTAGWESAGDRLTELIARLRQEILKTARLALICQPADSQMSDDQARTLAVFVDELADIPRRVVRTRCDLVDGPLSTSAGGLSCSAVTGQGISELKTAIVESLRGDARQSGELVGATAARCRDSLRRTADALQRGLSAAESGLGDELVALELREALEQLGEILGQTCTDDILDRVFSRFCIGK